MALTELVKENQMSIRDDFDALMQQLKQAIVDETTQVVAAIQSLKDQLAQGNPITAQDLTDLQGAIDKIKGIDPEDLPGPTGRKRS